MLKELFLKIMFEVILGFGLRPSCQLLQLLHLNQKHLHYKPGEDMLLLCSINNLYFQYKLLKQNKLNGYQHPVFLNINVFNY